MEVTLEEYLKALKIVKDYKYQERQKEIDLNIIKLKNKINEILLD